MKKMSLEMRRTVYSSVDVRDNDALFRRIRTYPQLWISFAVEM